MTDNRFLAFPTRAFVLLPTAYCLLLTTSGCRTATQVIHEQRVDLNLSEGNRGYLVGTPPPAADRPTTRKMVETVVEVPSFYQPQVGSASAVSLDMKSAEASQTVSESPTPHDTESPASVDSYVVKKGETLWSIAAKPEVFGNANQWRVLYEANRDVLKTPNRVREGMTLRIPRDGATNQALAQQESSEGVATFTK